MLKLLFLSTYSAGIAIGYSVQRGLQLQYFPFDAYADQLIDPQDYARSQALGTEMREAGVEAFQYLSARSTESGVCGALYTARRSQTISLTQPHSGSVS